MTTNKKKNLFYQRKKGEPIKYNGSVEPLPLAYVSEEWPDKLALKIEASPQDWNTLHQLAMTSPEYLGKLILDITRQVQKDYLSKEGRNLPRGFHNEARQIFMEEVRRYAAAAYAVISYWRKRPLDEWPDNLKIIIEKAEKKLGEDIVWPPSPDIQKTLGKESTWLPPRKKKPPKKSIDVIAIVKYLINLEYGRRRDELGLDNVQDMDNEVFDKTYLYKKKLNAAKTWRNKLIKKYGGDFLTIDVLLGYVPGFDFEWENMEE